MASEYNAGTAVLPVAFGGRRWMDAGNWIFAETLLFKNWYPNASLVNSADDSQPRVRAKVERLAARSEQKIITSID